MIPRIDILAILARTPPNDHPRRKEADGHNAVPNALPEIARYAFPASGVVNRHLLLANSAIVDATAVSDNVAINECFVGHASRPLIHLRNRPNVGRLNANHAGERV